MLIKVTSISIKKEPNKKRIFKANIAELDALQDYIRVEVTDNKIAQIIIDKVDS